MNTVHPNDRPCIKQHKQETQNDFNAYTKVSDTLSRGATRIEVYIFPYLLTWYAVSVLSVTANINLEISGFSIE